MHSTDLVMCSKHESWKINIEFPRPQQREDLQLPGCLKQNLAAFLVCKEMASHILYREKWGHGMAKQNQQHTDATGHIEISQAYAIVSPGFLHAILLIS